MTTDGPGVIPNQTAPGVVPPQRRRGSRVLLLVALVLVGVLIVGGGLAFYAYDRATAIDRSTPRVAVDQFLQAALIDADVNRVGLFVCRAWPASKALQESHIPLSPTMRVSWSSAQVRQISATQAEVTMRIRLFVVSEGTSPEQVNMWRFITVNENGWRVCSLDKT